MTKEDMRQLERDLTNDLVHSDEALLERCRKLVKQFLFHEAGKLTGTRVRDESQILELLEIHARVNLLRKVIENPASFSLKDQKGLFNEIKAMKNQVDPANAPNLLQSINELDIEPDTKAKLIAGAMDLVRKQLTQGAS